MLRCRDVPAEVSLALDDELTWGRRLALRFHVLMCKHCRRYLRQAKRLARAWGRRGAPATEEEVSAVLDACHRHHERRASQED